MLTVLPPHRVRTTALPHSTLTSSSFGHSYTIQRWCGAGGRKCTAHRSQATLQHATAADPSLYACTLAWAHVDMGACCVHACLLFVGCCMLSAACSPLHVVRCTLHFVCCVLSFACCQAAADALHALTTAVCAELSAPPPIVRDTCLLVRSALADEVCAAKP